MSEEKLLEAIGARLETVQQGILYSAKLQQTDSQVMQSLKDLVVFHTTLELQRQHKNPLNRFGRKCFSQTDEDGITLEIVRRLGIENGVYAEFGVGNGLENNTLILAALGWRGFWVGGQDLAFAHENTRHFSYIKDWITLDNVVNHAMAGLEKIDAGAVDVVSLDLDGNDIYFVEKLLGHGVKPKLFIVEYNAKFPPPVKFKIDYNPNHRWASDDYFGASLASYQEMFAEFGYKLICCNAHTGANAFFIHADHAGLFPEVPEAMQDIYSPPRYYLYAGQGYATSAKVVEKIMRREGR